MGSVPKWSSEERALHTLITVGYIPENKQLSDLTIMERQLFEARCRLEADISYALEKYREALRYYDPNNEVQAKFQEAKRQFNDIKDAIPEISSDSLYDSGISR